MEPEPHLDADTLAAYVDRRLPDPEIRRVDQHIDACGSCRRELSTLASLASEPPAALPEVASTTTLGRYQVLGELGRGAMGIVLRAHDPELARDVAIKVVRDVDGRTRELLRREARALAKLRHPHVVTVHDVIVEDDRICIAMELVPGGTLRAYCDGKPRADIVDACVRAGRGLAAAHDAGVVHRDFKPENVLCGAAGEVKVGDFGLAQAADDSPDGALCGTPAYMAPEVLRRAPATAASDQYSFCVSVHELLTGARPTNDAVDPELPGWIARVLRRGLAAEPGDRHSSMHAVVDALASDPRIRRRKRLLLAAAGLAALGLGAMVAYAMIEPEPIAACTVDEPLPAAVVARDAVERGLAAAADTAVATRVVAALDRYAVEWQDSFRQACTESDRRTVACLERSRRDLAALTRVLAAPDAALAARAIDAVTGLPDPRSCRVNATTLPADVGSRVISEHARTILAHANALVLAGKTTEAARIVDPLLVQLAGVQLPTLRAEALLTRARVETDRGNHADAEKLLFEALHAAEAAHDDVLVATIWVDIVSSTGGQQQRFELALSNARAADAALARITPSTELRMRYGYTLGGLLLMHGQLDEARRRLEAALAEGSADTLRQVQRGQIELALCDVDRQQGKLADARRRCDAGIRRVEDVLGPSHIRVAVLLSQVGALGFAERDLAAAERAYQRAIGIFQELDARNHNAYALALSNLGAVYSQRGELTHAKLLYRAALEHFDKYHPGHPQRLQPLQNLAGIMLREGNSELALQFYEQVRTARRATFAPEDPAVLAADYNLALAYRANKQPAMASSLLLELSANARRPGKEQWMMAGRALDLAGSLAADRKDYAKAIALRKQALDALSHVSVTVDRAYVLQHLGEAYVASKQYAAAVPPLEEALAYFETHAGDPFDLGTVRVTLARALGATGDDQRAVPMMRQAVTDLERVSERDSLAWYRKTAAAWLRTNAQQ